MKRKRQRRLSNVRSGVVSMLKGSSLHKPVSFEAMVTRFVDTEKLCTRSQLVGVVNPLLMPHGKVSGNWRGLWNGRPF
jgi:hypothetical protein